MPRPDGGRIHIFLKVMQGRDFAVAGLDPVGPPVVRGQGRVTQGWSRWEDCRWLRLPVTVDIIRVMAPFFAGRGREAVPPDILCDGVWTGGFL